MPQFEDQFSGGTSGTDSGTIGAMGMLNAVPFLNVLAPGLTEALSNGGEEAVRQQMVGNAQSIRMPKYQSADGVNVEYSGDYDPEMYGDPAMANATMIGDSQEGRAAQLAALQDMQGMANQAADSTYAMNRQNASMDARQLAQSREGAIRQDAMRRGQLGGAQDMISRQQAAQAAANQNLNSGMQSAQLQALQQLAGMQAASGAAGQLRGQDLQRNTGNAGIANQFELYNTSNINDTSRANTGLGNSAQLRNLGAQQNFMNSKTGLAMDKIGINNANRRQGFGDQMSKMGAVNSALGGVANNRDEAGKEARDAGKEGMDNFKSIAKMMGGGMG